MILQLDFEAHARRPMAAAFAKHPTNMRRERHKVQKVFPEQHFSLVRAAVGKHPAGRREPALVARFLLVSRRRRCRATEHSKHTASVVGKCSEQKIYLQPRLL